MAASVRWGPRRRGAGGGSSAHARPGVSRRDREPPVPGARPLLELVDGPASGARARAAPARRHVGARAPGGSPRGLRRRRRHSPRASVVRRHGVRCARSTEGGAERVLARRNEREQLILAVGGRRRRRARRARYSRRSARSEDAHATETVRAKRPTTRCARLERAHARALEQRAPRALADRAAPRRARAGAARRAPRAARRASLPRSAAQVERIAREHAERLRAPGAPARPARRRHRRCNRSRSGSRTRCSSPGRRSPSASASLQQELDRDRAAGEEMAAELRACAAHGGRDPGAPARGGRGGHRRRGRRPAPARPHRGGRWSCARCASAGAARARCAAEAIRTRRCAAARTREESGTASRR